MKKLSFAIMLALAAPMANATATYIDVQHDYDQGVSGGDNDTRTDVFTQMAIQFNSTSDITNPTGGAGNAAGLNDTFTDSGFGIVNGFLGPQVTTQNEFVPSAPLPQLTFWFDDIQGQYISDGNGGLLPTYSAGTLHFMFDSDIGGFAGTQALYDPDNYSNDANFKDGLEILTISGLTGGPGIGPNGVGLVLEGEVSFALNGWWFTDADIDFNTLLAQLITIDFRVDFNDDQAINDIGLGCDANGQNCDNLLRQSNHNGSTNITVNDVPEPSVIALLGIGLLGLGIRTQRKA